MVRLQFGIQNKIQIRNLFCGGPGMTIITLRLSEKLLQNLDHYAHAIHLPRAEYIRLAIEHMNKQFKNKERAERLKKLSVRVRKESMRINKEFSRIEHEPKD